MLVDCRIFTFFHKRIISQARFAPFFATIIISFICYFIIKTIYLIYFTHFYNH